MKGGFVVLKYYPNKDFEEQHEFVAIVETGKELDDLVLTLEEEQERYHYDENDYFDIVTLPAAWRN